VGLQVVDLAEADQPMGLEGFQDRVGESADGRRRFAAAGVGCRKAGDGCGSQAAGGGLDESALSELRRQARSNDQEASG
jgi:hypothetical protein